jgi:hypothetical protein
VTSADGTVIGYTRHGDGAPGWSWSAAVSRRARGCPWPSW